MFAPLPPPSHIALEEEGGDGELCLPLALLLLLPLLIVWHFVARTLTAAPVFLVVEGTVGGVAEYIPAPPPVLVPLAFLPRVLLLPPPPDNPMTPHPCRASCSYRLTNTYEY